MSAPTRTLAVKVEDVRPRIESGEIHTWADACGYWHAAVKPTYAFPKGVAKLAIYAEIADRQGTPPPLPQVKAIGTDAQGRTVYREAD